MDTGLAAYLTMWSSAETLENGAASGAFFETYVVSEIVKSYYNSGKPLNLYYYRDIDKKEIDLLIVKNDTIYPIEIKKNKNPSIDIKILKVLEKFEMNISTMIVLCMCNEIMPINKNIYLCPITII